MSVAPAVHRRWLATLLFTISVLLWPGRSLGQISSTQFDIADVPPSLCTVAEVGHEWLRVDGKVLYVEPFMAESNPRGDVFLAGRYNYLGQVDSLNNWKPAAEDGEIVGAYLPRGGAPRLVPSPFPHRMLSGFRAVEEEDGSYWNVVFGERIRQPDGTYSDSASVLWSGRFDGRRWSRLSRLPSPTGEAFDMDDASSLVQHADTAWWALRRATALGTMVLRRSGRHWSYTLSNAFLLSPALAARSGLELAAVGPDRSLRSDGSSLFYWDEGVIGHAGRKVVPSQREQVSHPSIAAYGTEKVITWQTDAASNARPLFAVHAASGVRPDTGTPVFTVDSANSGMRPYAPLVLHDGRPLWVTDHRPARDTAQIQFAIYDPEKRRSVVLGRFPHDFVTPFVVASRGNGDVLVSGGHYEYQRYGVSLLRTFRVRCPGADSLPPPPQVRRRSPHVGGRR